MSSPILDTKSPEATTLSRGMAWRKSLPWILLTLVVCLMGLGVMVVYLLTLSSTDHLIYEQYFSFLLWLNVAVATALALLILWLAWRLYSRWRRKKFGSRLMVKLAFVFALVGFLPGVLLYSVSYQFVSRTIEQWFDKEVDQALASGLDLGVATIDNAVLDLRAQLRAETDEWTKIDPSNLGLDRFRNRMGASDVVIWNKRGDLVAASGASRFALTVQRPAATILQRLKTEEIITEVQGLDDIDTDAAVEVVTDPIKPASIKAWMLISPRSIDLQASQFVVALDQPLPPELVANALAVQKAYRQYQKRGLSLDGLRDMYIGTLSLTLFLSVFGAVMLAILLGMQLVNPLLLLAQGVKRVAAGDLAPLPEVKQRDELSGLTHSFSAMTKQLADAQLQTQTILRDLDSARTHLQIVQDSLSSGLLILDTNGSLLSANPGANALLGMAVSEYAGQAIDTISGLEAVGAKVLGLFRDHSSLRDGESLLWEHVFELHRDVTIGDAVDDTGERVAGDLQSRSVVGRGTEFIQTTQTGEQVARYLVVLDDMTALVSSQRAEAWSEVARRLAHEIKNPLTPIRLSAERLEMKLENALDEEDSKVLHKSVNTIVEQVDALKLLVNEFRDYARLPKAKLDALNLNSLILEILRMYPEQYRNAQISYILDENCPTIKADAGQMRQVLHNLIQNAQYAAEHRERETLETDCPPQTPWLTIRTEYLEQSNNVLFTLLDNGGGFPKDVLQRAFEPYITTKPKGTGLGLPMVKKIVDDHGAKIKLQTVCVRLSEVSKGAEVPSDFVLMEMDTDEVEKNNTDCVMGAKVTLSFTLK